MLRKTYAEVRLDCIAHNIRLLRKAAGTDVMAVVKANAYGHGMVEVAKLAAREGVSWFGVATPDEGVALRERVDGNILVFSPVDGESARALVAADISFCAFTQVQLREAAEAAEAVGKPARIHLKIDTGMNRVGLVGEQELKKALVYLHATNLVEMEGVFTHFAVADAADKVFTLEQLTRFERAVDAIRAEDFTPIVHASNSAGTIDIPNAHFDLCRMGISMYGYPPSGEMLQRLDLKPALTLITHVSHIKEIHAGETVSYGRQFAAEGDEQIITVPAGYADGYRRTLSGKSYAIIHGEQAPIAGRVCMDQTMFRVTDVVADVRVGDKVILIGESVDADVLAGFCDTISYEILTGISARVPRVYLDG